MKADVLRFLQKEIASEHIPGAVIRVAHKGETVLQEAVGNKAVYPVQQPMQLDTVFDLASLTKVVATLPAVLKLIDSGELRLDDPVGYFLPVFSRNGKEQINVRHLLTHTSGLMPHRPFYHEGLSTEQVLERFTVDPADKPGAKVKYNDLGFITLYKMIEEITREPFPEFVKRTIFTPLNMQETVFNPGHESGRYAATEYSETLGDYKKGIVHDENTDEMGGISGHAGLFSTMSDLSNFMSMIENGGTYKGERILSESVLNVSRENHTPFATEYRGLGWILKSPAHSSCGDLFSKNSYGHTGFTGTSIWFDPDIDLNVILLTNRVHFGRHPHIIRLRPRLHNVIRSHFN